MNLRVPSSVESSILEVVEEGLQIGAAISRKPFGLTHAYSHTPVEEQLQNKAQKDNCKDLSFSKHASVETGR